MKFKQILIGVGVLAVLLIIVLFTGRGSKKPSESATQMFPNFQSDSVAAITLKKAIKTDDETEFKNGKWKTENGTIGRRFKPLPIDFIKHSSPPERKDLKNFPFQKGASATKRDKTTVLKRENDKWLVETSDNYFADKKAVEDMLSTTSDFKTTRLISKKSDEQSLYQVDSSGIEVTFADGSDNIMAHFFAGKTGPYYPSGYVRQADSDSVYLVDSNLQSVFGKESDEWRDKTIFDFNAGNVTKLTIASEGTKIALQLEVEGGQWKLLEPEAANAKKDVVDGILNTLSSLKTNDFAEKKELKEYGLDEPASMVSADLNDGTSQTLLIGKEESGKYYVKRADQDTVFLIYKYNVNQLLKKVDDLKAEELPEEETSDTDQKASE